ncbi:4939_t:CDS:2, partial [Racocetra fulgida]
LEPTALDMTAVDFYGVSYRISTPQSKNIIKFSMLMQCFKELVQWGAQDMLHKEYGAYILAETESGYDFSLEFDLQKLPEDKVIQQKISFKPYHGFSHLIIMTICLLEEREALVKKVSLIKRNLLAQPFERAFEQQAQYEAEEQTNPTPVLMQIHYRDQETIYIQAQYDRVTVIFSTLFKEETDRIFGRVFLQEFVDARRRPAIQKAPQVLYSSKDPPLEIRYLSESQNEDVGYVTF